MALTVQYAGHRRQLYLQLVTCSWFVLKKSLDIVRSYLQDLLLD